MEVTVKVSEEGSFIKEKALSPRGARGQKPAPR